MEVYIFRGKDGEKVPETVEKLIVDSNVKVLRDDVCYPIHDRLREVTLPNGLRGIGNKAFWRCEQLSEISISHTVQWIGVQAFQSTRRLKKVEFDCSASSPHQLKKIHGTAFRSCVLLLRIQLPSSVIEVGPSAFAACEVLVEAQLSKTGITKISFFTFQGCPSLQTVSLPNTVTLIEHAAFYGCKQLVTVVVPARSRPMRINYFAFGGCSRLANVLLPKDSTAGEQPFSGCKKLNECYGEDDSGIATGLIRRFDNLPIHEMCYDHSTVDLQGLRKYTAANRQDGDSLLDKFRMSPFHVLFSTSEPPIELLDVLLDLLPNQILRWKDANDRRPLDYLINNWTDGASSLVQRTLQKSMIDPLARWGAASWIEDMQSKVQEIISEDDKEQRTTLCNNAYSAMEHYEKVGATSILEMALWKAKLKSGRTSDGAKRQALNRVDCRCLSGSNVVIPRIAILLGIPPISSSSNDRQ